MLIEKKLEKIMFLNDEKNCLFIDHYLFQKELMIQRKRLIYKRTILKRPEKKSVDISNY
jgi:hypothetical protein